MMSASLVTSGYQRLRRWDDWRRKVTIVQERMNVSENKGEYNYSCCDRNNVCRKRKSMTNSETRQIRITNWELILPNYCERNLKLKQERPTRESNPRPWRDWKLRERKGRVAHNRAPNHAPCLVAHWTLGQASSGRYLKLRGRFNKVATNHWF